MPRSVEPDDTRLCPGRAFRPVARVGMQPDGEVGRADVIACATIALGIDLER